jgi:hypothetical protein
MTRVLVIIVLAFVIAGGSKAVNTHWERFMIIQK